MSSKPLGANILLILSTDGEVPTQIKSHVKQNTEEIRTRYKNALIDLYKEVPAIFEVDTDEGTLLVPVEAIKLITMANVVEESPIKLVNQGPLVDASGAKIQ